MSFLRLLLLLFIAMPVLEMWVLIEVGGIIGPWPTIGLVLLTAAVGYGLLRQQGFATLMRGQQRMEAGELPAREMVEGMALAVSGALLLTPGFVTDTIGFLGLISPLRAALADRLLARAGGVGGMNMSGRTFTVNSTWQASRRPSPPGARPGTEGRVDTKVGNTYEGEYEGEIEEDSSSKRDD